jgi:hypothetical protein
MRPIAGAPFASDMVGGCGGGGGGGQALWLITGSRSEESQAALKMLLLDAAGLSEDGDRRFLSEVCVVIFHRLIYNSLCRERQLRKNASFIYRWVVLLDNTTVKA